MPVSRPGPSHRSALACHLLDPLPRAQHPLTFLWGTTWGMYCRTSWARFRSLSSSWNSKLGLRSLNNTTHTAHRKISQRRRDGPDLQQLIGGPGSTSHEGGSPAREGHLLAQPVVFWSEAPPAVSLVEDHQPVVDRVEELQGFPLSILCSREKNSLSERRLPPTPSHRRSLRKHTSPVKEEGGEGRCPPPGDLPRIPSQIILKTKEFRKEEIVTSSSSLKEICSS